MSKLPRELLEKIALYLPVDSAYVISRYAALTQFNFVPNDIANKEWNSAILSENMDTIRFLQQHKVTYSGTNGDNNAMEIGNLEILKSLTANNSYYGVASSDMEKIATEGYLDILEWFFDEMKARWTLKYSDIAAKNGHLEMVKYLLKKKKNFSNKAIDYAAENGHLEVVKLLHSKRKKGTVDAIDHSSKNGHLEVVKFLFGKGHDCTNKAIGWAAKNGHLDVVKYLNEVGKGCLSMALNWASGNGHLNVVKYLVENRKDFDINTAIEWAEKYGQTRVFNWLLDNKD